jgi:hypothetical protein
MADNNSAIPKELSSFIAEEYGINAAEHKVNVFEHIYKYGRNETVKLAVMPIPLPQGQR